MELASYLFVFILILSNRYVLSQYSISRSEFTKLLVEYAKIQRNPARIVALTCWEKRDHVELLSLCYENGIMIKIIKELSTSPKENKFTRRELFVIDSTCPHHRKLLEMANDQNLFGLPYKWLILNTSNISDSFAKLNILSDSNFVVVSKNRSDAFRFELIYKISRNHTDFIKVDLTEYSTINQKFNFYNDFTSTNRSNLRNNTVTVSYVQFRSKSLKENGVSTSSFYINSYLIDMLNASQKIIVHNTTGVKMNNSSLFTGVLGDLQSELADMSGTVVRYRNESMEFLDHIAFTGFGGVAFIFKAPPLSYVKSIFPTVFDTYLWYGCYAIVLITTFAIYAVIKWEGENLESLTDNNPNFGEMKPKLAEALIASVGIVSQQGTETEPKSHAGRTTLFVTLLCLLFLNTAYSANIIVLLQSTSADRIKTPKDLLDSRISLGGENIYYVQDLLANYSSDPISKEIYRLKIAPQNRKPNFMSAEEGINKLRTEFFAFFVEKSVAYKQIKRTYQEHEKCGLQEVDYLNMPVPSIVVAKHSGFKEIIKVGFRKLRERGIHSREVRLYRHSRPKCTVGGGNFSSVGIQEVSFATMLLGGGIFGALIFLLLEKTVSRTTFYKQQ